MAQYKKYQVISYHPTENGYDEKGDHDRLEDAKKECKQLLYHDNPNYKWYAKMYILTDTEVILVFDEYHKQGRKPYDFETNDFAFAKPKAENSVQLSLNF